VQKACDFFAPFLLAISIFIQRDFLNAAAQLGTISTKQLTAKRADPQTSTREALVYGLFRLSVEEIAAVEGR
jgi:hypothetical protein